MNQKEKHYRVGLYGHFGQNNLGDEAVILSAIQNLSVRIPDIELVGLSKNPRDTIKRYGIESFPIRYNVETQYRLIEPGIDKSNFRGEKAQTLGLLDRFKKIVPRKFKDLFSLKTKLTVNQFIDLLFDMRAEIRFLFKVKERLNNLDILLVCGSGQIEDDSGSWEFPYTLMKWVLLAKYTNTKVFVVSVGTGPPTLRLSIWFYKNALTRADYLSYRDSWSKKKIEDRIPGIYGLVYNDLAFSLKNGASEANLQQNQKIVAINLMPVSDEYLVEGAKQSIYKNYLNSLTEFINHIQSQGYRIHFFNSDERDLSTIDELLSQLRKMSDINMSKIEVIQNETVQDLVKTISEAHIVVATRFHSTVLPLCLNKPVLGICYHRKSKELLYDIGLEDYCVDLKAVTGKELCNKFDNLCENITSVKRKIESRYKDYAESLDEQWDRVAELIKT